MKTVTTLLRRFLLALALLGPSLAAAQETSLFWRWRPRSVPEFDPAAAGIVAVIVAGGTAMLARRKRR